MSKNQRFTFMCDSSERKAITELARRLQRSQSDSVRFLVTEAVRRLAQADYPDDPLKLQPEQNNPSDDSRRDGQGINIPGEGG